MEKNILEKEKSLFDLKYMKDIDYLNKTIDDNYLECGKSGLLYNKEYEISNFLKLTKDRQITIYNFECQKIDLNTYIVHYFTNQSNNLYYRTSIWKKIGNELKILYHQATPFNGKVTLHEF